MPQNKLSIRSQARQAVSAVELPVISNEELAAEAGDGLPLFKTPTQLLQEGYLRTERLLALNESKLAEGVRLENGTVQAVTHPIKDLSLLQKNIQDLQQTMTLYADALQKLQNKSENKPKKSVADDLSVLFGNLNTLYAEEIAAELQSDML